MYLPGGVGPNLFLCNYWNISNVLGGATRLSGLGVEEQK